MSDFSYCRNYNRKVGLYGKDKMLNKSCCNGFLSCLQGSGAKGTEAGSAVLPGLSGADSYRPACSESGFCYAGVHTIRVCVICLHCTIYHCYNCSGSCPTNSTFAKFKTICIYQTDSGITCRFFHVIVLTQRCSAIRCVTPDCWLGWRPSIPFPIRPLGMLAIHFGII